MISIKLLTVLALIACANCRYLIAFDEEHGVPLLAVDLEDESVGNEDNSAVRVRRQTHGSINTDPNGAFNINTKTSLAGNDKLHLSALGGVDGLRATDSKFSSIGGGLALEHLNGHALSVTGKHIPDFGNQLTAAGKVNLINDGVHKANANAFITQNMPKFPNVPNFNTHGGSLDYLYKDKVGGSFGVAQTPFLQRTDYSAMGNLNLFRNPSSSLDLNAGFSKSVSPYVPKSSWQPSGGLSFTKFW